MLPGRSHCRLPMGEETVSMKVDSEFKVTQRVSERAHIPIYGLSSPNLGSFSYTVLSLSTSHLQVIARAFIKGL